ncbi:MAG: hypothetical protein R3D02_10915 [Hyphomicrobiales bacterium]
MALGSYSFDLLTVLRILEGPSYQDAGKIVFINSDGTRISAVERQRESFTYDEFGTVTGGTIDKIRYLSADATTAIATYRDVGADIGELVSLVSQLGAYRSSISWASTLPSSTAGMTSTDTAVTFPNIDGTYPPCRHRA